MKAATAVEQITGILPALFTPMDSRGDIQHDVLARLVDWLIAKKVHGLYVCGSTGEGVLLTEDERKDLLCTVISASGRRVRVMVHVGAMATDESIRLAKHAQSCGADAISAIPPTAFGRGSDGILTHYRAIARSTDLPLYLYNYPSLTGTSLTADLVSQLLTLPTVRGLKFSDAQLFEEFRLIRLSNQFDVLHGSDELLLYGLMLGAVGGIGMSYCFLPTLVTSLHSSFLAGDLAKANSHQIKITEFIELMLRNCGGNLVGLGKVVMSMIGFECGSARLPNPPISEAAENAFRSKLDQTKLIEVLG